METSHLDTDQGLAFIGPRAEARYGRRNFAMDLLAVFTAAPEVVVVHGRQVGSVDPMLLVAKVTGPRIIALAGRPWLRSHRLATAQGIRRAERTGPVAHDGPANLAPTRSNCRMRCAGCCSEPRLWVPSWTTRAINRLGSLREQYRHRVAPDASVVTEDDGRVRWWTFAGAGANAALTAAPTRWCA